MQGSSQHTAATPGRALPPPAAPGLILTVIFKVESSGLGCLGSPKLFHVQPSCPHCRRAQVKGPLGRAGQEPCKTGLEAGLPGAGHPCTCPDALRRTRQPSSCPTPPTLSGDTSVGATGMCVPPPQKASSTHQGPCPAGHRWHTVGTQHPGRGREALPAGPGSGSQLLRHPGCTGRTCLLSEFPLHT